MSAPELTDISSIVPGSITTPEGLQQLTRFLETHPELVNIQDEDRCTLLDIATLSEAAVRLLLSYGANPNPRTEASVSPLHFAVSRCGAGRAPLAVVQMLLEAGANPNGVAEDGSTPIFEPGKHFTDQATILLELLLRYGADPFVRDNEGNTPLHFCYNEKVCSKLLDLGLDPNARNRQGHTPLFRVMLQAATKTIGLLAQRGAEVNLRDEEGRTILHLAVRDDEQLDSYGVRRLIKAGADIEAGDNAGRTPLHIAVGSHFLPGIRALLQLGAKAAVKDNKGMTPLDLVLSGEYWGTNHYYVPPPRGQGDPDLFHADIQKIARLLKRAQESSQSRASKQ